MAVLSTSYEVESSVKTTLKNTIAPSTTANIQVNYALTITSGVLNLDGGTENEEYMSFGGATVLSGITTLSDVVRGLNLTGDTFTGSASRAKQHIGGASTVELTNYHSLYNLKANKDRSNTFTAAQTISGTNKWFFNDSDTWIYDDGTDLKFKSSVQSEVSLSALAAAAGTDEKTKVTINDTTGDYLSTKISAGDGIASTIINPGANEQLDLDLDLAASSGLEIDGSGKVKIKTGSGIIIDGSGNVTVDTGSLGNVSATDIQASTTYGESVAATGAPLAVNGDGRLYNAQADVLNDWDPFVGVSKSTGVLGDIKNTTVFGPVVTIAAMSAQDGREWTGQQNLTSNASVAVTGNLWKGQTFTPAAGQTNIDAINIDITKNGSPAGNYLLKIFNLVSGVPSGAAIATSTVASTTLATGLNEFQFASLVSVTPGTVYGISLNHSLNDGVNNISWKYNNSSVYAGGNGLTSADGGANWSTEASNDYVFQVIYKSVSGSPVFLQNTEGTLGLTPGTYHKEIGRLLDSTKLILNPQYSSIKAILSFSGGNTNQTVDTKIIIGFRARMLMAISEVSLDAQSVSFGMAHFSSTLDQSCFRSNIANHSSAGGPYVFPPLSHFDNYIGWVNPVKSPFPPSATFTSKFSIIEVGPDYIVLRREIAQTNNPANQTHTIRLHIW